MVAMENNIIATSTELTILIEMRLVMTIWNLPGPGNHSFRMAWTQCT